MVICVECHSGPGVLVIAVEPPADLSILAVANAMHRWRGSLLVERRFERTDDLHACEK